MDRRSLGIGDYLAIACAILVCITACIQEGTPKPTPTATLTATLTLTETPSPTETPTPSPTPEPTDTPTLTPTLFDTPTPLGEMPTDEIPDATIIGGDPEDRFVICNVGTCNIRACTYEGCPVITQYFYGDTLPLDVGYQGGDYWRVILSDGNFGYAHKDYSHLVP